MINHVWSLNLLTNDSVRYILAQYSLNIRKLNEVPINSWVRNFSPYFIYRISTISKELIIVDISNMLSHTN